MKIKSSIAVIMFFALSGCFAQAGKEFKSGHVFYITLPDYMSKTSGLNSSAIIQFKSNIKNVFGIVIEDVKEDLVLAELNYTSINEFAQGFVDDLIEGEEKPKVSKPVYQKKGGLNFVEYDVTLFDKELNEEIYYLVAVAETNEVYYKFLLWSGSKEKDKFKADFQKIIYSIRQ